MSADLSSRIRQGLTDVCDEAGAPADGTVAPFTRPAPAVRTRRVWLAPLAAAMGVAAVLAAMVLVPHGTGGDVAPVPGSPHHAPAIARTLPGAKAFAGRVDDSPPGPASMVVDYINPVYEDLHSQVLAVASDGHTYREVPDAGMRSILAPDGNKVVSGDDGRLKLIDLRTGDTTNFEPGGSGTVTPSSYSPDGRHVLYQLASNHYNACPCSTVLLDLRTGHRKVLSSHGGRGAAFSPDSTRIATESGDDIAVMDLTGRELDRFPAHGGRLYSGHAWSPDGTLLALSFDDTRLPWSQRQNAWYGIRFLDLATGKLLPAKISFHDNFPDPVLGWTDPRHVVIGDLDRVVVQDLDGHIQRVITDPVGGTVDDMAAGLLPKLVTVDSGTPDYGPWPTWLDRLVIGSVTMVVLLVFLLVRVVLRRRRRRSG
ncbi:MAG: hypothetical protein WCA46_13150 [Actinocatenispora sp.]